MFFVSFASYAELSSASRKTRWIMTELETPSAATPGQALKVLIADDDRDLCLSLRDVLEAANHLAEIAHSGHAALAACSQTRYAALLLDIGLPDLSGLKLISHLEEAHPELAILIITGQALRGQCRPRGQPLHDRNTWSSRSISIGCSRSSTGSPIARSSPEKTGG